MKKGIKVKVKKKTLFVNIFAVCFDILRDKGEQTQYETWKRMIYSPCQTGKTKLETGDLLQCTKGKLKNWVKSSQL